MKRFCVFRATPTEEVWARLSPDDPREAREIRRFVETDSAEAAFRHFAEKLPHHLLGQFMIVEEEALSFFYAKGHFEPVTTLETDSHVPRRWQR